MRCGWPHRAGLWFLLLLAGSVPLAAPAATTDALYARVAERLALMRDVAAYKWHHDLPVADPDREAVVIAAAAEDALRHQVRPATAERFFGEQIEAAKDIQRYWFDRWRADGAPDPAPDLGQVVRPRLIELGDEILALAGAAGVSHDEARFSRTVATEGLGEVRTHALFEALAALERYPSRLDQVLETGVLRIGTTGDYAPFSHAEEGGDYAGADIDLARDLAMALGVDAVFFATSWPTLLDDLEAGRYDIAMSGVSRTLARARVGYLSAAYFVGGKLPIARCENRERFDSLDAIDQPDVRVIVNPGGTNEAFVDEHLHHARKVLYPDNRTIFDALAEGQADVMITDSIEVTFQTHRNPALCATLDRNLTYQEKGYLMPRDEPLRTFVDTWLSLRLGDGTVTALLERYLSP